MILEANLYELWSAFIAIPGAKTILIVTLLSAIEISPIKINPWSWVGGLIGNIFLILADVYHCLIP